VVSALIVDQGIIDSMNVPKREVPTSNMLLVSIVNRLAIFPGIVLKTLKVYIIKVAPALSVDQRDIWLRNAPIEDKMQDLQLKKITE